VITPANVSYIAAAMGNGRDKRGRKARELTRELNQLTLDVGTRASGSDPPALGEPDVPVRAPLKPKPHVR
jgi:hypothetical protein